VTSTDQIGQPQSPRECAEVERPLAAARAALGEAGEARFGASRVPASRRDLGGSEAAKKGAERQRRGPVPGFAAAWAAGCAMSLEQAIACALDEPEHDPPTP
jgi:hypothetical protein